MGFGDWSTMKCWVLWVLIMFGSVNVFCGELGLVGCNCRDGRSGEWAGACMKIWDGPSPTRPRWENQAMTCWPIDQGPRHGPARHR